MVAFPFPPGLRLAARGLPACRSSAAVRQSRAGRPFLGASLRSWTVCRPGKDWLGGRRGPPHATHARTAGAPISGTSLSRGTSSSARAFAARALRAAGLWGEWLAPTGLVVMQVGRLCDVRVAVRARPHPGLRGSNRRRPAGRSNTTTYACLACLISARATRASGSSAGIT